MAKSNTVTLKLGREKADDDEAAGAEPFAETPLFSGKEIGETVDHILVQRMGPVEEGSLGRIDPGSTEDEVARRWGGGKYKLIARNAKSKPVAGGFATIDIAGEPRFKTPAALKEYETMIGKAPAAAPAPAAPQGIGIEQILTLFAGQDARARADAERRQAEADAAHKRELERLRLEADMREKERRADDERRAAEARERDERRQRESEEREERRAKEASEDRKRMQEHQAFMLQLSQTKGGTKDPTETLLAGVRLALELGEARAGRGDGDGGDPVSELVHNLPTILEKAGALRNPSGAPPAAAAADKPDEVTLAGDLGRKAKAAVDHLKAQGIDPTQALDHTFTALLRARRAPAAAAPPQPAPPPAAAQEVPAPALAPAPRPRAARRRKATARRRA
jgi:hypothetical protein